MTEKHKEVDGLGHSSHEPEILQEFDLLVSGQEHQADAAHGSSGMPQLDPTHFASQLFWLAVTFVLLYVILSRKAIPAIRDVLESRQTRIEQDLDRARQLQEEAEAAEASYNKALEDARKRSAHTIGEMQQRVEAIAADEHAALDAKLQKQMEEAEATISETVSKAKDELTPAMEEISSAIVEKLTRTAPDEDKVKKAVAQALKDAA